MEQMASVCESSDSKCSSRRQDFTSSPIRSSEFEFLFWFLTLYLRSTVCISEYQKRVTAEVFFSFQYFDCFSKKQTYGMEKKFLDLNLYFLFLCEPNIVHWDLGRNEKKKKFSTKILWDAGDLLIFYKMLN